MQVFVEDRHGQRFRVVEGWESATTIFDNSASADLLDSFPPTALDQIFDRFLAQKTLLPVGVQDEDFSTQLFSQQFPAVPAHFSSEHQAVYSAVRSYQLLIEEAPFSEGVLDDRQSSIRHGIRQGLQRIVAEERAEAARIQSVHEKRSELGKVGAHVAHGLKGLGSAAWGLGVWVKDVAEVALIIRPARMRAEMIRAASNYAIRDKSLESSQQEYFDQIKKEVMDVLGFDPTKVTAEQLAQAFDVAQLVYDDAELRADIGRFAKDYASAQHSLEISEIAGGGVFEIVLTIVLAVFTGGVGAVAVMAKNTRLLAHFKNIGELFLDFTKCQKQRIRLAKRRGVNPNSADFRNFESEEIVVAKRAQESGWQKERKVNVEPRSDSDLARSPGHSAVQVRARRKLARDYMEKNGFTDDQIRDALGSADGAVEGGVDFNKPLEIVLFPPPDYMTQYVNSHGYPGNWFDPEGGQSPDSLGISGVGRTLKEFKMPTGTGLQSHSKAILDTWTTPEMPVQTNGGGVQLIVNDDVKNSVNILNGIK
ncbi:hypothetical protein [Microbulbifer agarilyticus]